MMAQPDLRPETLTAVDAVSVAMNLALAAANAPDVTAKDGRDIVTTADVAAEDSIRATLTGAHGLPVVGEERGGNAPVDGSPYWLVDPICGTRNYASGTPLWCVNLALVEDGAVSIAVVADPSASEVLIAERGNGAWALKDGNLRRLAASAESRTVVVEEGKSKGAIREHAARFMAEAVRADRWDFRSLGTTLSLAYLAAGRISAYVVMYVSSPLHAAAGTLLVAEAGGVLSDVEGNPWTLASTNLLAAADATTHDDLRQIATSTAVR
jgi:myo-inositol-1(or 4)-monophosphatase